MSTRELIDKEIASLPEELQRKVYDFAMRLKRNTRDEAFNGAELSESVLALDWNSPQEDTRGQTCSRRSRCHTVSADRCRRRKAPARFGDRGSSRPGFDSLPDYQPGALRCFRRSAGWYRFRTRTIHPTRLHSSATTFHS